MSAITTQERLYVPHRPSVFHDHLRPFPVAMQNTKRPIEGTDLCFNILTDPQDIDKAYQLRYEVFGHELKTIDPCEFPDGREHDTYDDNGGTIHTAITESGRIIAYTRLVLPCEQFPIECSNVLPKKFDRTHSIEVSRALLVKEKRGPGNIIWHLFSNIYKVCQEENMDAILSFSTTMMRNGYRKRGIPFRYEGDPVTFHGHTGHALIINVDHQPRNFLLH